VRRAEQDRIVTVGRAWRVVRQGVLAAMRRRVGAAVGHGGDRALRSGASATTSRPPTANPSDCYPPG
jgi:hypothetical protein